MHRVASSFAVIAAAALLTACQDSLVTPATEQEGTDFRGHTLPQDADFIDMAVIHEMRKHGEYRFLGLKDLAARGVYPTRPQGPVQGPGQAGPGGVAMDCHHSIFGCPAEKDYMYYVWANPVTDHGDGWRSTHLGAWAYGGTWAHSLEITGDFRWAAGCATPTTTYATKYASSSGPEAEAQVTDNPWWNAPGPASFGIWADFRFHRNGGTSQYWANAWTCG
jgi:hypothetical protein